MFWRSVTPGAGYLLVNAPDHQVARSILLLAFSTLFLTEDPVETWFHHRIGWTASPSGNDRIEPGLINFRAFCFSSGELDCQGESRFRSTWAFHPGGCGTDPGGLWGRTRRRPQGFCGTTTPLFSRDNTTRCGRLTHRQLGAGLADRLGGDDPHRFTDIHQLVVGKAQP